MHNGELAKKYQVSPALTRKECPESVLHLHENIAALWVWLNTDPLTTARANRLARTFLVITRQSL